MKLKLTKPWAAPQGTLPPGEYDIPGRLSMTHARCAVIDGAGEIVFGAREVAPATPFPGTETKENPDHSGAPGPAAVVPPASPGPRKPRA